MKITCIIVEDEPLALEKTKGYVQKVPFLQLLATFDNALDALGYLKSHAVDLLLLDIQLGDFSGIQLLEASTLSSQVILTTAYHEYALQSYDLKVSDYLLKPFTFERFVQAIDRVQSLMPKPEALTHKAFVFVKTENRLEKILLNDILFIEGMGDYRRIHTATKKIMTLQTFTEFEQTMPPQVICRVHKSYMVGIGKIDSIERDRILIQKHHIPISDTYKQVFYGIINQS
jgi:two-component system, LytTR family, response regulator